ncbi:multidrug resistance-associated protein 1-like isoform X2 [Biomphalaria glabrata]|uniref:ABC-type glutathione-S-conjugate transporter n=1 Tax=Biomphalaria glabrata TaxID=6526 RepID=A0A9W2YDD7_BIOGL|nr:multidrug resistance-associated protein 1-like isoform X2 [Biomphalaria glabrata]KAI8743778.1 multidrug resistance-associated protein 1-like isoform X2 [Biomphalaria glabrata]
MLTFEDFCGGPLWNHSEFLSSSWPKLTPCFQQTMLVWIPCCLAALFGPFYVFHLRNLHLKKSLPLGLLNFWKTLCHVTMAVLTLVDLLDKVSLRAEDKVVLYPAYFTASVVKIVTFTSVGAIGQYERICGITASLFQLAFWAFMSTSLLIITYINVILEVYIDDFISFVIFIITVFTSVMCFILNCVSEHHHGHSVHKSKGYRIISENVCPELQASALSQTFFCWMFSTIYRGYKKGIEESDLWSLPPYMECEYHFPKFEKLWKQEILRCKGLKKSLTAEFSLSHKNDKKSSRPSPTIKTTRFSESTRLLNVAESPKSVYTHYLDKTKNQYNSNGMPGPSLISVLWKQFKFMFFQYTWTKLVSDMAVVCGPLLMQLLLAYMETRHPGNEWQGYCIVFLMLVVGQFRIAIYNYSMGISYKMAMMVRSVLVTAIYKKALRISNESKKKSTVGEIVNLMSVDAQRVQEFLIKISFCHTTPVQAIVSLGIIYSIIGPAVLAGSLVLVILVPVSISIAIKQRELLKENLKFKDNRLRMLNEIFNGIKALKLYAWEKSFHDRVEGARAAEISTLFKISMFYVAAGVCWNLAGYLMALITFTTYLWSDPEHFLDPSIAFMALALFNILQVYLDFMASIISLGAQAYVSARRIGKFLEYEELRDDSVTVLTDTENVISIKGAELTWDKTSPSTLKNITLNVPKGQLVAVVGQVGSGKSSLVSAILGDMEKRKGSIARKGTVAYVPQQAWIQNATVRDNIIFGKGFRERKYKMVVSACELERDFGILIAGDQTEIGEKGINLSGGQKQRVSVARAVYQDCDIYLLDDPLSAVDSHVGKAMFDNVIGPHGLLKDKTRILVTHGVHFLPQVDTIVVMNEGQISEVGSYEELLAHDGPFARFLKVHLSQEQLDFVENEEDPEIASIKDTMWNRVELLTSDAATSGDEGRTYRKRKMEHSATLSRHGGSLIQSKLTNKEVGKLITLEVLAKGRVSTGAYAKYLKAAGVLPVAMGILMFWCYQAVSVGTNYWLTSWTGDDDLTNRTSSPENLASINNYYLSVYAIFGLIQLVFLVSYYYLFWTRVVQAGKNLHSQMTERLFKAPMSFFDTTPVGRILNRCSRDIEVVDNFLPIICRDFIGTFGTNVITIIVIMIETPVFGAVLVPIIFLFLYILKFFVPTSRQLRRIEHIKRSPIYMHFSESVTGASVIRAYGVTERFIKESEKRVNHNTLFFFATNMAIRWLSVNLDTLANLVIFFTGFLQVYSSGSSAGQAGLTVSYALQVSGSLPWMVRQVADFETNVVSVERIKEYSEIEQEADWIVPNKRPHPTWPSHGLVQFKNFSVRYREGLSLVIRGMTITIQGGEKVGIVGRTGAGKSSLSLSLFRLMEAADGCILIDGVNISDLGLHDLRSRLTILPQDPILFSGTLRMNLDPFNEFSDDDIWTALERSHLKVFVSQLPDQLMYPCGEEGQNLSVGQRQLICLTRTLLRKTKILVLDEATAAVDIQTDTLIQNTIRFAFQSSTIIAIAHRLNTILDYDKVMVLDAGIIKEYGTPNELLENTQSIFYSMAADAKLV